MAESKKSEYVALSTIVVPDGKNGATKQLQRGDAVEYDEDLERDGHIQSRADFDAAEKARADAEKAKQNARDAERAAASQAHFDAAKAEQREFSKDEMPSGKSAAADAAAKK